MQLEVIWKKHQFEQAAKINAQRRKLIGVAVLEADLSIDDYSAWILQTDGRFAALIMPNDVDALPTRKSVLLVGLHHAKQLYVPGIGRLDSYTIESGLQQLMATS